MLTARTMALHPIPIPMHTLLSYRRRASLTRWVGAAAVGATIFLAACGPSDVGSEKLKKIPAAARREAVLAAMGTGPLSPVTPSDQPRIVNGFRRQMYFTNGKTYEIFWYRSEPGTVADPIVKDRETPVVMEGDTLAGWGWKFFTPYAATTHLPDPTQDKARLDSIVKSQRRPAP
ncbi:MAG: hypothetical protein ABI852_05060 [Gemmatimonadaceae bacterium]